MDRVDIADLAKLKAVLCEYRKQYETLKSLIHEILALADEKNGDHPVWEKNYLDECEAAAVHDIRCIREKVSLVVVCGRLTYRGVGAGTIVSATAAKVMELDRDRLEAFAGRENF